VSHIDHITDENTNISCPLHRTKQRKQHRFPFKSPHRFSISGNVSSSNMKFSSALVALLSTATAGTSSAFVASSKGASTAHTTSTQLQAAECNNNFLAKACATAAMTAFLWGSPSILAEQASNHNNLLGAPMITNTYAASAKEMASGSGSRVNKDPESLLRLGLPINNKEVSASIHI
jgi:hypothetical protein